MNKLPKELLDNIVLREGGYVYHPADRGGPTKYGVTLSTLKRHRADDSLDKDDVRQLTSSEAREIFEDLYWFDAGFSELALNDDLMELIFDSSVNHGVSGTIHMLQKALDVSSDGILGPVTRQAVQNSDKRDLYLSLLKERYNLYARIVRNDPTQGAFIVGWLNRMDHFLDKLF